MLSDKSQICEITKYNTIGDRSLSLGKNFSQAWHHGSFSQHDNEIMITKVNITTISGNGLTERWKR